MGVRGEMELYSNLTELLNHHRQVPLSNYSGVLTEPCGHQPSARADGGERKVRQHLLCLCYRMYIGLKNIQTRP